MKHLSIKENQIVKLRTGTNNMSKTLRWYHILDKFYNPQWFKHELKCIRIKLHRRFRYRNKVSIKKGLDVESEPKTTGWETY